MKSKRRLGNTDFDFFEIEPNVETILLYLERIYLCTYLYYFKRLFTKEDLLL